MTIGSQTPTISPVLARTCASTHFSRITSNALIFFDAATPLVTSLPMEPKNMPYFCGPCLPNILSTEPDNSSPTTGTLPIKDSKINTNPASEPPSLPSAKQDHSIFLLTGASSIMTIPSYLSGHAITPCPTSYL